MAEPAPAPTGVDEEPEELESPLPEVPDPVPESADLEPLLPASVDPLPLLEPKSFLAADVDVFASRESLR